MDPRQPLEFIKDMEKQHRGGWESGVVLAMGLGLGFSVLGAAAASIDVGRSYEFGILGSALGLALVTFATMASRRIETLRVLTRKSSMGSRYDQLRNWTRLKAAGILLNILVIIAVAVLAGGFLQRTENLRLEAPFPIVFRLATLAGAVLLVAHTAAHWLSLRTPVERRTPTGPELVSFYLAGTGAVVLALMAAVLAESPLDIEGVFFRTNDAPFVLLASATLASVALFLGRPVPTLAILVAEEREYYSGHTYLSRHKSVMMPVMIAFALLFLVLLVVVTLGVGLVGLVEEIPRNTILIGVLGFIAAALVASVAAAVALSRSEDSTALYRTHRTTEQRQTIVVLGASAAITLVLVAIAAHLAIAGPVLGLPGTMWLDFVTYAVLAALGPYGFYVARSYHRIRMLEERFPDFLRDLAASRKAGLTLPASVAIAARGEYGALTPEIVKMADQLSWDVPFEDALKDFANRVRTPLVQRAVSLIIEASRSGGNVTDVLLAAARDAREIKNLENERRTTMSLYTAIIYITFFVFLSVAAVLYGSFIPEILRTSQAAIQQGAGGFAGMSFGAVSLEDYRVFYFSAALVQAVGNGMVGGLMGSGKVLDGLRHAFIMVLIAYLTFAVLINPGGAA